MGVGGVLVLPVVASYVTADTSTPQIAAARSMRRCLIRCAVCHTLADIPEPVPLPALIVVKPMESVSE